jgi:hypothetical protein
MIVYTIDTDGLFIAEHKCQIGCFGEILYPVRYSEIEPPVCGENESPFWTGITWEVRNNFKGITIYNKETKEPKKCETMFEIEESYTFKKPFNDPCNFINDEWVIDQISLLQNKKEEKKNEIDSSFNLNCSEGHFLSISLGIEVDCRRSDVKNDKQNVESLISYMHRNNINTLIYPGYGADAPATKQQLQDLVYEMEDYGVILYAKKKELKRAIDHSTTVEQVQAIVW